MIKNQRLETILQAQLGRVQEKANKIVATKVVTDAEVDVEMAEAHLAALGIGPNDPVIIACWGGTNRYFPKRDTSADLPYDWGEVTKDAAANGRNWPAIKHQLTKTVTKNLGFVPSPGGTSAERDKLLSVTVLLYEIDEGLDRQQQWGAWERAGLPEPTLVVDTGNKSLHVYYLLDQPCGVSEGEHARKRLSAAIEAVHPGVATDHNLWRAGQVARLAGGIHPKSGERTTIALKTGKRYPLGQLMALCPEVEAKKTVQNSDFNIRPDQGLPDPGEWFPEFPIEGMVVPLEVALGTTTRELLEKGMDPSSDERFLAVYRLGKVLRAARLHLESLDQEIEGGGEASELRLLTKFIETSEVKGGDVEYALQKHWRPEPCGESDLSNLVLKRKLRERAVQLGAVKRPHPLGLWAERMSDWDWLINTERTPELVVFNALLKKAAFEGRPITSHQQRFLRYNDRLGFFEPVSTHRMQQLMLDLLPYAFSRNAAGKKYRKHITAARAKSCTDLAALKLHEDKMDLEEAVAFRNGTYLLSTGELVPHSPARKLTWAVDAEFTETAECPPTMKRFIATSFGAEWESIIQVVLRYMVDPSFKCSRIVMILGASGSGKGTLERLIEKLFPPSVVSVITSGFADINHPDKIRQFVSGKRLLAFPDLQGRQFGVGTLYALTDGGKLTGRTLHESDAEDAEPFSGRVVICSTQPPLMDDAGNGMTRRMLVLPTCRPAGVKADLDLDEKLEGELGQIVSWALRASRQEVKRLLAGGDVNGLLRDAATAAEVDMDPIRSFANACLVPKPANYLPNETTLFKAFEAFCSEQNHRPTSQRTFISRMGMALSHLRADRRSVPGSNSAQKAPACFFGFGVKDGLVSTSMLSLKPTINPEHYVQHGYEELKRHHPAVPDAAEVFALLNPDSNKPCSDRIEEVPDSIVKSVNPPERLTPDSPDSPDSLFS
jgi:phage/plasmid-associated DNA primase